MSFLSGIVDLTKSAVGFLSGNSIVASMAKTALMGFALNKLSKNTTKGNDTGTQNIDQGVRLQVTPDADSKIPILYGSAFFGGNLIDAAMTNSNKTMWYALALTEKTGTVYSSSTASAYTLNNVYWNNQRIIFNADGITANYTVDKSGVIDRNISGQVRVYFYAGGRTAGQLPSGYAGTAPGNSETLFPNWTSGTHALTNVVFALVRVDYNREKNITGLGDMLFNISNSMFQPGDVIYDYLTNTTYGAGITAGDILTADVTALNTYSVAGVAYADQGTGAETLADRYQINGLIDSKNPVLQNAEAILNATASWLSYDTHEGKWGIVINKADTSVASFDDSNIIGSISLGGTGLQDLYNSVKVQFPHRELRDSADFYNIAVPTSSIPADWTPFSRNTNEENNTLEITYDIINEPIQAQMLGLIELKQSRIDKIIQFQTDFSYYNIKAGDIVDVTNTRFGFSSKLFRVISVTEVQDDGGALQMDITALEYDVNVYSIADLYRFTRSDVDGIIPLGAIGTPGTPTVTKVELDARPRVNITTTAPTGLVEGMEYWLTTDVALAEENRSYTLIATKKPVGGGVYTSGTAVVLDYDNLGTTNFFVKTRGFNTNTVGPFSTPSGLVEFVPVQTTDAIDANTQAFDSTGGLLGALALIQLLTKLSDLFGAGDSGKSIFDKIFETFEDVTGIDLVGDAAAGDLVVASNLAVKADGVSLGATTASIDFIGPIKAQGTSTLTVKLKDGTANKDILAWNSATSKWETISGCIDCEFPAPVVPPAPATPCSLTVSSTLPANNFGGVSSLCTTTSTVPFTGSYFIKFAITRGTLEGGASDTSLSTEFTAALVKGTGSFKLYGTDGKLEDTKAIAACTVHNNVIEIPFSSRAPGKDYYVIWDEGVVTSCTCENAAVDNATTWAFTTSIAPVAPFLLSSISPVAIATPTADSASDARNPADTLAVDFTKIPGSTVCSNAQKIILTFSQKVKKGSGFITLKNTATGSTISTFAVSASTIAQVGNNWTVDFGTITSIDEGVSYDLIAPRGLLLTDNPVTTTVVCDKSTTTPALPDRPSRAKSWSFITGAPLVITNVEVCTTPTGKATLTSNIKITFNKTISKGTGDIIINDGGFFGTVQKIDINGTYATKKYATISGVNSNILTINPTKAFTPNTNYHITMVSGVLRDSACDVPYDGVSDTTTISWKTDGAEPTAPQALNFGSVRFDLEYDRPITLGSGKMNVVAANGTLLTQISPLDLAVRIKYNERF
jgi:hypothetical protein